MRTKLRNKGIKLFFDPSHTFGPLMRDEIVNQTIKAMQMMMPDGKEYLYDGVLIEVGTAKCDRHQHITVEELDELCQILSCFRVIEKEVKSLPASYDHALDLHKNR
jgi:3-deoxy-D-arabino-heptulosonate 7-phosphate (DAHP) synthase